MRNEEQEAEGGEEEETHLGLLKGRVLGDESLVLRPQSLELLPVLVDLGGRKRELSKADCTCSVSCSS